MTDIAKTPEELFEAFQEASLSQDADAFAALFSDDARLEFPFAGLAFAGRAAIRERAHQVWEGSPLRVQSFRVTSCKQSPDGCLVAEYQVQGSAGSVVRPFSVGGVAVLEARGGRSCVYASTSIPARWQTRSATRWARRARCSATTTRPCP